MILGWSPFKIVSVSAVLYPRWPPLLKIEISSNGHNFKIVSVSAVLHPRWPPLLKIEMSSNGQNCSILSQKVPKFELYNHNEELFNIYYRIFYELWTFAYFDRLCKLEKAGMKLKKNSSLKLLSQSQPHFAEMILGWSPFKIVSVSAVLYPRWPPLLKIEISSNGHNFKIVSVSAVMYPRWPPLLKIEISSNGQNCSILSQKVPKFELYKHNDELFNKYYGIFYELWTFPYFDWICKLEKKGDEIKKKSSPLKLLSQSQPNFAEMILGWSPFKIVSVSAVLYPRWPPLLKI